MRDDIHKEVPAPTFIQTWIKKAIREADQLRSIDALAIAVQKIVKRDIAPSLLEDLRDRFIDGAPQLFGPLEGIGNVRSLGGLGSGLENSIVESCKRYLAEGVARADALVRSLGDVLADRVDAHIRAAEPVLLGTGDKRAHYIIAHLSNDREQLNFGDIARACLGIQKMPSMEKAKVNLEEDLTAPRKKKSDAK